MSPDESLDTTRSVVHMAERETAVIGRGLKVLDDRKLKWRLPEDSIAEGGSDPRTPLRRPIRLHGRVLQ